MLAWVRRICLMARFSKIGCKSLATIVAYLFHDAYQQLQALKYRSVMDIVQPTREIVRRGEETVGHSVRPKWN